MARERYILSQIEKEEMAKQLQLQLDLVNVMLAESQTPESRRKMVQYRTRLMKRLTEMTLPYLDPQSKIESNPDQDKEMLRHWKQILSEKNNAAKSTQ